MPNQDLIQKIESHREAGTLKEYLGALYYSDEKTFLSLCDGVLTENELKEFVEPILDDWLYDQSDFHTVPFLLKLRDENYEKWNLIYNRLDILSDYHKDAYEKALFPHINALIEQHRKAGDFDSWVEYLKENDKNRYDYVVFYPIAEKHRKERDIVDFCLRIKEEDFDKWQGVFNILTQEEKDKYNEELDSYIDSCAKKHEEAGDFDQWFKKLKENDIQKYLYVAEHYREREILAKYNLEIAEHGNNDDLLNWLWNELEKSDFRTVFGEFYSRLELSRDEKDIIRFFIDFYNSGYIDKDNLRKLSFQEQLLHISTGYSDKDALRTLYKEDRKLFFKIRSEIKNTQLKKIMTSILIQKALIFVGIPIVFIFSFLCTLLF